MKNGEEDSYYVNYIQDYFENDADVRSFALRLVIHYIGDVHQPLHATTRVDSDYPKGDKGGNSEKLPSIEGAYNLHSVWDSIIYAFPGYPDLPLSRSSWDDLGDSISNLMDSYTVDESEYLQNESSSWANESL